jgi:hypothetical protein
MKKPNGKTGAADASQFASDVIEVYKAVIAGKPRQREFGREVRQAAHGLAALRQASDYFLEQLFQDDQNITGLPSSALMDAAAILDALTSGKDHPIWRHIDGVRSVAHRPGRAPKATTELLRQSIAGGLVLALQEAGKLSGRQAAVAVISRVQSTDFSFTFEQLRKWAKHDDAHEIAKGFIQTARNNPDTKSLSERVMIAGHTAIYKFWSTPV